jgi:hypothetical protein
VTKAAEQMPEENYAFKPTPKTGSFGELIAHVSDTSYGICAGAIGDKTKSFGNAEKTMTRKTEIVAALGFNTNHTWEHYGNFVTCFRLKDLVPPSSRSGM